MSNAKRSYSIGAAIGVLSWIVFVVVNSPIGITTALSEASGAAALPFLGLDGVQNNPYWAKTIPAWDYGTLFLFGTFLGALISAVGAGRFRLELVPPVWKARYGKATSARFLAAFFGGTLAMFGARLAGGCTSGHGISGSLQLAVSSWVFFVTMFITAVATAKLMFASSNNSKEES